MEIAGEGSKCRNNKSMTVPNEFNQLGIEVAVGSIEKELKRLWEADEARTNASLINFAVYTEKASTLVVNSLLMSQITREHACRAILIGIDRAIEEPSLHAWITAHCHLLHGKKSVCCEQIAFYLTGKVSGRLRNTVFAHLNSDLPLVFWWQGELSERFNERLYSLIDRLIIDSSDWVDVKSQLQLVMEAMKESPVVVQDLSWTRTYQMRLSVAALFDDPIAVQALPAVQRVRIFTSQKHRMSGLQMLAWLAVQAGWQPAEELFGGQQNGESFHYQHPHGGEIIARVEICEESASLGMVEISSPDVIIRVTREKEAGLLFQQLLANGHKVEQHAPADGQNPIDLVRDQLSRGGKNSLFRKVMPEWLRLLDA